jgi:hypothetical protein
MVSPICAGSVDALPLGGGAACLPAGPGVRGYWQFAPTPADGKNGGKSGPVTGATGGRVEVDVATVLAELVAAVLPELWRVHDAIVMATATMPNAAAILVSFIIGPAEST